MEKDAVRYSILGFIFWVILDWGTVGGFQLAYFNVGWLGHLLRVVNFVGYPLIFAYFIFYRNLGNKKLFYLTLFFGFVIEVVLINNSLLYTFPKFILFVPLAIGLYAFLTYMPLWIVKKEIKQNKNKVILISMISVIAIVLSVLSHIGILGK